MQILDTHHFNRTQSKYIFNSISLRQRLAWRFDQNMPSWNLINISHLQWHCQSIHYDVTMITMVTSDHTRGNQPGNRTGPNRSVVTSFVVGRAYLFCSNYGKFDKKRQFLVDSDPEGKRPTHTLQSRGQVRLLVRLGWVQPNDEFPRPWYSRIPEAPPLGKVEAGPDTSGRWP